MDARLERAAGIGHRLRPYWTSTATGEKNRCFEHGIRVASGEK